MLIGLFRREAFHRFHMLRMFAVFVQLDNRRAIFVFAPAPPDSIHPAQERVRLRSGAFELDVVVGLDVFGHTAR